MLACEYPPNTHTHTHTITGSIKLHLLCLGTWLHSKHHLTWDISAKVRLQRRHNTQTNYLTFLAPSNLGHMDEVRLQRHHNTQTNYLPHKSNCPSFVADKHTMTSSPERFLIIITHKVEKKIKSFFFRGHVNSILTQPMDCKPSN